MKIIFTSISNSAPVKRITRRIATKKVELPSTPSLRSFISDPRLCLSTHIRKIEVVEALGLKGRIQIFRSEELPDLFARDKIRLALNEKTRKTEVILSEAYEAHRFQIFRHEADTALRMIENNHGKQLPEKELYDKAEQLVFNKKSTGKNLRHLSFMLKEAAEANADYLAAVAILIHNLDDSLVRNGLLSGKKKKKLWIKMVEEVLTIKKITRRLNSMGYSPPPLGRMPRHHIQNYMDAIIKLSEGNGRALLILLVHRFSSLMRKHSASENTVRRINELYAPLAERFGMIELAKKLKNEAFRLDKPKEYFRAENEIIETIRMSREEAELFIGDVADNLRNLLSPLNLAEAKGRVKNAWEAYEKTIRKKEDYPEVFYLEDILGCMGITEDSITFETALEIAKNAVGTDFMDYDFEKNKTEIREEKIGRDSRITVHYIAIKLNDGNFIEFQFMDKRSYEIRERGAKAHFVYKLTQTTGQEFDEEILELCRQKMNGDLNHDVQVVYETLKPWVYVFFDDPRFSERIIRVLRREEGSIPLDAAHWIMGKDISGYNGVRIRKLWENRLDPGRDEKRLEDGDFIKLNPESSNNSSNHLTEVMLSRRYFSLAKDPLTRLLILYTEGASNMESDARKGEIIFKKAINKAGLRFNKRAIEELVQRKFRMNKTEFFAAVKADILPPESVFEILAPKN